MKALFSRPANKEFAEAIEYYAARSKITANNFIEEVEKIIRTVENFPLRGQQIIPGVHTLPLRKFPYSLVYKPVKDTIGVVAIAHQSRRPNYWIDRV
jgi:plasmid stabilization system protein ParE